MKTFTVSGKVWRYEGPSAWYFVYVNKEMSRRIKDYTHGTKKSGFHFVRVRASLGTTSWTTSLFPTKDGPYLLAIKADVRHKEGIDVGDAVHIECTLVT